MIVRTITAHCDNEACSTTLELDPQATQAWHTVQRQGWRLVNTDDAILTYCPEHKEAK